MQKFRRVFVAGDIHGDWIGFLNVLNQMIEDGLDWTKDDLLVFVGDYVDGFPYSKQVVDYIKGLQEEFPDNVVALVGNHEELMVHGVDFPRYDPQFRIWWEQGGKQTWESYWGEEPLSQTAYVPLDESMYEHIEWFKTLPTMYESDHYIFVHAGVDPDVADPRETSHYARLWIRGPFLRSERQWDKLIVHGHSPVKEVEVLPNRVNVNTRPRQKGRVSGAQLSADEPKVIKVYGAEKSVP